MRNAYHPVVAQGAHQKLAPVSVAQTKNNPSVAASIERACLFSFEAVQHMKVLAWPKTR